MGTAEDQYSRDVRGGRVEAKRSEMPRKMRRRAIRAVASVGLVMLSM